MFPIDVAPALADGEEEIGGPAVGVRPTLGGREESEQVLDRILQRSKVSRPLGELIVDRQQQGREFGGDRLPLVGLNDQWRVHRRLWCRLTDRAYAAGDSLGGARVLDDSPCPPGHNTP